MKPQSMLQVSVMLLALLVHSATTRHNTMMPSTRPARTNSNRVLLQTAPKAADNNNTITVLRAATGTKPASLNMTARRPNTLQTPPPQTSPVVVVKSGPTQPPVPTVSGNGRIGPFTFGALAGIASAVLVASLCLCVVLSCWCHRRRGKAVNDDLPVAVTAGELRIKSSSS